MKPHLTGLETIALTSGPQKRAGRWVKRLLWLALAAAVACLMTGCHAGEAASTWLAGGIAGLCAAASVALVWVLIASRDHGGFVGPVDDTKTDAAQRVPTDPLAMPAAGLDVEALRQITTALILTAADARESVRLACSAEDYGDRLAGAMLRLDSMIGCLQGIVERCAMTTDATQRVPTGRAEA